MNKKIDFFNKDNNISNTQNNNMKKNSKQNSGSKTIKPNKSTKQITIPKRRGRRPKKIIENLGGNVLEESQDSLNSNNDSAVILRLNIDPSKIISMSKSENTSDTSTVDDTSSEGMFNNDIPRDNICHSCVKKEKMLQFYKLKLDKHEKKDKQDNSNKMFFNKINFISIKDGKKISLKKTTTKCWWDRHEFDNLPFFLPELYHSNSYYVLGNFCSFNCALAHNLHYVKDSKMYERKSLIFRIYREMKNLSADDPIDIKEAGPWELLESFGGSMSIIDFRNGFDKINREYIRYMPPIKPITIYIEERNIDNSTDDFDKEYVLKRRKPLAKKRSIISSLTNKLESD